MTRFSAIGISLFTILTSNLIACGDGETGKGPTGDRELPGEGGGAGDANGGATSSVGGQGQTSGASSGASGSGVAGAPMTTGGSNASAGQSGSPTATGGAGGSSGQGGATTAGTSANGGTSTSGTSATGGATSAGTSASGGSSSAGTSATGGSESAGTSATGGSSTAGTSATGTAGAATGGAATGGAATGGAATGGVGTGGTTAVIPCTASFIIPTSGETLTEADDISGNYCANGFFYDVIVATDAPNGTAATLTIGSGTPINGTVQNAVLKFASMQLATTGSQDLNVQIAGTAPNACSASAQVNINCAGHSTCNITAPTFTATHVALNGVPKAQSGDRISSEGSPYQAAFEVTTDIESGQAVSLEVKTGAKTDTVYAVAIAGKASFPGVTLVPDGSFTATASCQARSGFKSTSTPLTVPVDTTPPDLSVTKGTGAGAATISALADGDHFGPADDADPTAGLQIKICGATTAVDALDFDAGVFGTLANNLCVSTGGNSPLCAAASAGTGNGACVNFPCPGNGPFDLNVTVKDKAQNPVTITKQNLTCAAANPIVEFRDPVSGGNGADSTSFTDQSLRILAASAAGAGQKKDKTGGTLGAQYDVVICTSAPAGSTAVLAQGWYGDSSMTQLANATVAADSGNLCGGAQPSVVVFQDVTLHESTVKADFTLDKATELKATITDLNFGVGSATIDVWVDSVLPSLSLVTPVRFCGSYINSGSTSSQNLTFGTTLGPVTAKVTAEGGTSVDYVSAVTPTFSQLAISGVAFPLGINQLTAAIAAPSGNRGVFPSVGICNITVGNTPPPVVTWSAAPVGSSPIASSLLTAPGNTTPGAIGDADIAVSGWQGTLRACANLTGAAASGVTLQFSVNGTDIGTPVAIDSSNGCASLAVTTADVIPEAASVQLSARTSVTSAGIGVGTINVPVDVTKPATPVNLDAKARPNLRRQTTFAFSWNLPLGGSPAGDYEVRVARTIVDDITKFAAAEVVPYNGVPQSPGSVDSVDVAGRLIETGYYFAVQATDAVGNKSAIAFTPTATIEHFIPTELLSSEAGVNFGWAIDGSGDINGDGYADLVVGPQTGKIVAVYLGSASGYSTTPSTTIQGTASYFGYAVSIVGDINKDGMADLAIGSPREGGGAVYIYYGRSSWPALLTSSGASATITVDANADSYYSAAYFGNGIARLGDFNSDGVDDMAIAAPGYNPQSTGIHQGQVAVVYGKSGGLPATTSLPAGFGSSATRIDGDGTSYGSFGLWAVGSGYFYGGTTGTSLLVSAPYMTTTAGARAGRIYSIQGKVGTALSIALTGARHVTDGTVASGALGFNGIAPLGDVGPGGQPAFGIPVLSAASSYAQFRSGAAIDGPMGSTLTVNTLESSAGRVFARMVAGGGVSGSSATMSLIGNSRSDVVVSTQASSNHRIFVVDGTRISLPGTTNIETIADVVVALPAPTTGTWGEAARQVTLIRDSNLDGYADIAVGDVSYSGAILNGRVIVLR